MPNAKEAVWIKTITFKSPYRNNESQCYGEDKIIYGFKKKKKKKKNYTIVLNILYKRSKKKKGKKREDYWSLLNEGQRVQCCLIN